MIATINKIIGSARIIVILLLLPIARLNAGNMNYGFAIGLIDANCKLTNTPDAVGDITIYYPRLSFNLNGYIQYKNTAKVGFSAQPGFIAKGALQKNNTDKYRFNFNYFQLP